LRDVKKKRAIDLAARVRRTSLWAGAAHCSHAAQEPHAHLRLNAAGVDKMSEVLLGFAKPILDRLAPLDEKKAMLLFAITA
jgi:hypothetical protein